VRGRFDRFSAEIAERYPRVTNTAWLVAGLVGALWVLALGAVLLGLLVGAPGPTEPAPTVDFDDEPGAVLGAASERLDHRDFTVEEWVRTLDFRDGSVSGGRFFQLHVEHSRGQVRGTIRPASPYSTQGFVGEQPAEELFVADGAAWVRLRGQPYWQRSAPAANVTASLLAPLNVSRDQLADAEVTVVTDNETTWAAEVAASDAPNVEDVGTVRYVVARGEDPHLQRIRIDRPGRLEARSRVIRVVRYEEARAIRPAGVPWTTVGELRERAVRGLGRLV
jgi:hypothetical protein